MSFTKFTDYRRPGAGGKMSIRFTDGIAYLSAGFLYAASSLLRKEGTLDEGEDVRFVELFFDKDSGRVGVKPVGHKGLKVDDVKKRSGVRQITGAKTKSIAARGFQEEFGIPDKTTFRLTPETHKNPGLPEGQNQFILFVSPPPGPASGD
jgi:hypothetical protein